MNWIKFILWLSGLYSAYYLIMIGWDHLRYKQMNAEDDSNELSFTEQVETITIAPGLIMADLQSPIYASGGVTLKNTFDLCRDEAVEYIRQVSF